MVVEDQKAQRRGEGRVVREKAVRFEDRMGERGKEHGILGGGQGL